MLLTYAAALVIGTGLTNGMNAFAFGTLLLVCNVVVIVLALGGLMYGFLAMEGHAPPPRDLWLLAQAAANDARIAWRQRDR